MCDCAAVIACPQTRPSSIFQRATQHLAQGNVHLLDARGDVRRYDQHQIGHAGQQTAIAATKRAGDQFAGTRLF